MLPRWASKNQFNVTRKLNTKDLDLGAQKFITK